MTKTFISIRAIAATIESDKALLARFPQVYEGGRPVTLTGREAVNVALIVGVLDRSLPEAYAAKVRETVSLEDDNAQLTVDLAGIGDLQELCEKLGKQAFAGGHRRTIKATGVDDGQAQNASEHLGPLLAAIAATVRAQAAALRAA